MRRARARAVAWRTTPRSSSSSARASAALALAALVVSGCGHHQQPHAQNAHGLLVQAQHSLSRIHSGNVTVHVRADTPVPLKRTQAVPARDLPLSRLRLARWTGKPQRVACGAGLQCVRGQVDVNRALDDLRPLLPSDLPVDPSKIHDAVLEVALRDHKPVYLKLSGKIDAGFLLGDVPFEVELDLPNR